MWAGAMLRAARSNVPWRWWRAWSALPPPPPLQALLDWLWLGRPIDCYVR